MAITSPFARDKQRAPGPSPAGRELAGNPKLCPAAPPRLPYISA